MACGGGGSLLGGSLDHLEPKHLVGEVQAPLELGDHRRLRRERHDDVIALALPGDLVGQAPPSPSIHFADVAPRLGDDLGDPIDDPADDRLVGLGGNDEHHFVGPQVPTSSGLDGPPPGSRTWLASRVYRVCRRVCRLFHRRDPSTGHRQQPGRAGRWPTGWGYTSWSRALTRKEARAMTV